jgi:hypothetical protein
MRLSLYILFELIRSGHHQGNHHRHHPEEGCQHQVHRPYYDVNLCRHLVGPDPVHGLQIFAGEA